MLRQDCLLRFVRGYRLFHRSRKPVHDHRRISQSNHNLGNQVRNENRGPFYFDTDFDIEKAFDIPKWDKGQFPLGARFFNLFNHPDFYFPVMNNSSPAFGTLTQTVSTPTSIFGSGLGAVASVREIQLQAKFQF
jgi:hypothetical protein